MGYKLCDISLKLLSLYMRATASMYLNVQYVFVNFANTKILHNGKLSREKSFTNFAVLWLFMEIWGCGVLWRSTSKQAAKIVFFTNSQKFSLLKVSHYTVKTLC